MSRGLQVQMDWHRASISGAIQETDPGNAGTITVVNAIAKVMRIVTEGAETRVLYDPQIDGVELQITVDEYVGDCVISTQDNAGDENAVACDESGNNTITLGAAGYFVVLRSVKIGSNYRWRVISTGGAVLSTV